jgi:hypothetical protein
MKTRKTELAGFHRSVLMDDMMQVVGVDLLEAIDVDGGESYVRARAICHSCTCKSACAEWLQTAPDDRPQDFCPNADFFHALHERA